MISHFKSCVAFLFSFLLLLSCAKDSDEIVGVTDNLPEVKEKIFGSFNGLILDEQEEFLAGALVMIGGESTMTDDNGFFAISGFFNPDGTSITVTKEGYFDAHGRLIPYPDVSVNTKVKMIPKINSVKGETDKIISFDTKLANVTFAENSYVLGDIKYEGSVEVIGTSINIADPEYSLYSPGTMQTVKDGKYKMLFPYGRINVEIYTDSGTEVDISSPAIITFDIDEELLQMAPEEVPLWYLDESSGLWIEDGIATKSGTQYIGEVNHFTDWCAAFDANLYTVSGNVTRNGQAYANANMGITLFSVRISFKTAEDGSYRIPVFDFEDFTIDVTHNIDITKTDNSYSVNGFIYCDDQTDKVDGGYVIINFNDSQFSEIVTSDGSGAFSFFYEDCNNQDITITAYDPIESKQSGQIKITGDAENLEINVCKEELTGSIRIEIDGEEPYIIPGLTVEIKEFKEFENLDLPGYTYIFNAVDNYTSLPNVTGEFAVYEIIVHVSVPGEIQLPCGPIATPLIFENGLSDNAPFFFDIIPCEVNVLFENDESVVIQTNTLFPISKWEEGVRTELQGQIVLEGIKI